MRVGEDMYRCVYMHEGYPVSSNDIFGALGLDINRLYLLSPTELGSKFPSSQR